MQSIVPECISHVHSLLGPDWDWSGTEALPALASSPSGMSPIRSGPAQVGSNEDLREKAELQKAYYTFLNSLSQSNHGHLLLHTSEAISLGDLLRGASSHVDPVVRKLCIATLGKLSSEWMAGEGQSATDQQSSASAVIHSAPMSVQVSTGLHTSPTKLSPMTSSVDPQTYKDLRNFVLQSFGCEVLIESLTVKLEAGGVDIRDAAAISLLTEVSTQLKNVYAIGGDEYLSQSCGSTITKLGWPREAGEQLAHHIVHSTVKQLKDYLKTILLEFRKL